MNEKSSQTFIYKFIRFINIFILVFTLVGISLVEVVFNNNLLVISANTVENYYSTLDTTKTGSDFRSELATLITTTHTYETTYSELKDVFKVSDADPDNPGNIIWFYSGTSVSFSGFGSGNGTTNREHVWPKEGGKAFPKESKAGSDAHHLRPAEAQLNSTRNNLSFGVVEQTKANIVKQDGSTTYDNLCFTANGLFYPGEGYRGATARILMYVQTRWGNEYDLKFVDEAGNCKTIGKISDLLKWHLEEPVTEAEIARNEAIYKIQGNRNPFIDHPEYATKIYCYDGESYNATLQSVAKEGVIDSNIDVVSISLSGTPTKLEYTAGDKFIPNGLVVTATYSDGTVKTVSNSACSWVDEKTGSTTLTTSTTSIKCSYSGFEAIFSGIKVKEKAEIPKQGTYQLVTDVGSLKNGDKIIIVSLSNGKIAGEMEKTYLKDYDVTFSNELKTEISSFVSEVEIFTLNKNGDYWEIVSSSGKKLGATAVKKLSYSGGDTNWIITISNNEATIQSSTSEYGRILYNVNSPRFTTYSSKLTSSMLLPQIYKKVEGEVSHTCVFDKEVVLEKYKASNATCTKKAQYYYSCSCGEMGTKTFEYGDLKDHTIVIDSSVSATCEVEGLTEGKHCSTCGKVLVSQQKISKLEHQFSWVIDKEPTLDEAGIKHLECSVCHTKKSENTKIDKLDHIHEMEYHEKIDATCEKDGSLSYYLCNTCNKKYSDTTGYNEIQDIVIKATGHEYADPVYQFDYEKNTCIAKTVCKHNEEHTIIEEVNLVKTIISEATCEKVGKILYEANFSNEIFIKKSSTIDLPKISHNYGNWIYTKKPIENENGEIRRVCSICQHSETKVVEYSSTISEIKDDDIVVKSDELGVIVNDTKVVVSDNSSEYLDKKLSDFVINKKINDGEIVKVYDISLLSDNCKIQPNGTVQVIVSYEVVNNKTYYVAYIDGENMTIHNATVIDENHIMFETNHFSNYAIIESNSSNNNYIYYIIGICAVLAIATTIIVINVKKRKKNN